MRNIIGRKGAAEIRALTAQGHGLRADQRTEEHTEMVQKNADIADEVTNATKTNEGYANTGSTNDGDLLLEVRLEIRHHQTALSYNLRQNTVHLLAHPLQHHPTTHPTH